MRRTSRCVRISSARYPARSAGESASLWPSPWFVTIRPYMLMSNPSAVLSPTGSPDNASFRSAAPFGAGESSEAGTSAEAKGAGDGSGETLSMRSRLSRRTSRSARKLRISPRSASFSALRPFTFSESALFSALKARISFKSSTFRYSRSSENSFRSRFLSSSRRDFSSSDMALRSSSRRSFSSFRMDRPPSERMALSSSSRTFLSSEDATKITVM